MVSLRALMEKGVKESGMKITPSAWEKDTSAPAVSRPSHSFTADTLHDEFKLRGKKNS